MPAFVPGGGLTWRTSMPDQSGAPVGGTGAALAVDPAAITPTVATTVTME
ncbi:hypothetical protein nbrc107697_03910 [Gordonia crocea]|uniref:Uncharacterized protein n=1 Tax=Gordonia crocea TaxID=589162 RepID=A0A7M3SUM8_9ACTN|nr:hypothetical protein nbrc107697_03910 [Gordonia crocea]